MIFFCFFSSKKKRRRFVCEPSVLCSALGKMAEGQKDNCSAVDFLLRGRLARESWRAGAADTGRDKAEEGGIPAVVFRPTTTQDVPASVRLRACASRASRPFFLLKRKEGVRFLFLKKRNKRHCGIVDLSEKRCFPARPARNEKTDGSHTNRPFCVTRWRKQREQRKKAAPQLTFFCFLFFLERKESLLLHQTPLSTILSLYHIDQPWRRPCMPMPLRRIARIA